MKEKQKLLLCILDGLGLNPRKDGNAVALAKKPTLDRLISEYPNSTLTTFGERVGLPEGQMGNSEVGHLNIGAGRVVEQSLLKISKGLQGTYLNNSKNYKTFIDNCKHRIHLVGLYSDGGVHSHKDHLLLLIDKLSKDTNAKILLHLITDGRDTQPEGGAKFVEELENQIAKYKNVSIATVCGRFFAMDRDKRWERTKKAYDLIISGKGDNASIASSAIRKSYEGKITDEFIEPITINYNGVEEGDGILFWNFREDRMRQIVRALCIEDFDGFPRSTPIFNSSKVLCFTEYDITFNLPALFFTDELKNHLGEVISLEGLHQLRVAETEKYPHVTYFFDAGIEKPFPNEDRIVVPSPRDIKTYDQKPEMSARGVCEEVVRGIESDNYEFIVVNFANCDMVGHTGDLGAAIKAVEVVDECLGRIIKLVEEKKWIAIIIADHGNAEQMIHYEDNTPHTAHTTYPVPVILVGRSGAKLRDGGALCDIAPTVLECFGIPKPREMTGQSLIVP